MFEGNRLAAHLHHGITTLAGLVTMLNSGQVLAVIGAIVGLGGLLCSISREVRGFLDYLDRRARRRRHHSRPHPHRGTPPDARSSVPQSAP